MLAHFKPFEARLTRRAWLLGTVAAASCARKKGKGFPGYALVANAGERALAAVDLTRFAVAKRIGLEAPAGAVAAHPTRPAAYVMMPQSGGVWEIDAATLRVARKASLGGAALGMRLSADGKSVWVLQERALVRLDGEHLRVAQTIRLPDAAEGFDMSPDGRAAIHFRVGARVALVRLNTSSIEHTVEVETQPSSVCFQSDGNQVLVGSRADRSMTILDAASGRTVVRLRLPVEPANLCFNSDGGQLFVTGPGMDAVAIIFPYQTEVGETILAGRTPAGMAVTATPAYLFVTNPESGSLTVLDVDTRKLIAQVAVGQEPRHVLITPDDQYALVLNRRSGDMAVVWIRALTARRHRTDPPPLFTIIPVGEQPVGGAVVAVA